MGQDEIASVVGSWETRIRTPIGTVDAVLDFTDVGGALHGVATVRGEPVDMRAVVATPDGARTLVTWSQRVTRPMRLDLDFEVVVDGDGMTGTSRAGRLPRSAVAGTRVERPRRQA